MAQRICRYCRRPFTPVKPSYWWCSWECHERYREREGRPTYSGGYDEGWRDGYRVGHAQGMVEGRTQVGIDPELWKQMLRLSHPDCYQDSPLLCAANTVTKWLIAHRPGEASKN
jgi:hypothetical protein